MLTKKDVLRITRGNVYSIGYCKAQYLLMFTHKVGYNSGIYGFNYDVYIVGDDTIITGYRPFKAEKIDFDLLKMYEDKARKAQFEGWQDVMNITNDLLLELLKEAKKQQKGERQ